MSSKETCLGVVQDVSDTTVSVTWSTKIDQPS
jgi:hypothetical protein